VLEALTNDDAQKTKDILSEHAIEEETDLDDMIDNLFAFVEGETLECKDRVAGIYMVQVVKTVDEKKYFDYGQMRLRPGIYLPLMKE